MIAQVGPKYRAEWLAQARTPSGTEPGVLYVREPWELQTASVQPDGFAFVHFPMGVRPVRLGVLDPDRPVACLCHHGGRSMQVAAFLAHHGFAQVANVAGGIHAWALERDPSVPCY